MLVPHSKLSACPGSRAGQHLQEVPQSQDSSFPLPAKEAEPPPAARIKNETVSDTALPLPSMSVMEEARGEFCSVIQQQMVLMVLPGAHPAGIPSGRARSFPREQLEDPGVLSHQHEGSGTLLPDRATKKFISKCCHGADPAAGLAGGAFRKCLQPEGERVLL